MHRHTKSVIGLVKNHLVNPLQGAEIGVWQGGTSVCILQQLPNIHLLMVDRYSILSDTEKTVDHSMGSNSQEQMNDAMIQAIDVTRPYQDRRTLFIGDSVEASIYIKDEFLDFVFIDAHHSYESVLFDTQTWFPKVKNEGLVCGHDYDGRGDQRGHFGVKKAVDEFARTKGYEIQVMPGHIWWLIK